MTLDELQNICEGANAYSFYDNTTENDALVQFFTHAKKYMPKLIAVARAAQRRLEVWTEDTYRDLQDALKALEGP